VKGKVKDPFSKNGGNQSHRKVVHIVNGFPVYFTPEKSMTCVGEPAGCMHIHIYTWLCAFSSSLSKTPTYK